MTETQACQNCHQNFTIEHADFEFYEKIKVLPPTWCPECRMQRRMAWRNEHGMYLRPDSRTGRTIFSMYSPEALIKVWDYKEWQRDMDDARQFKRGIDWDRPFLTQIRELMLDVPFPALMLVGSGNINSDYCNDCRDFKNCYLAFSGGGNEDVLYSTNSSRNKESMELNETTDSELTYECFFCTKAFRTFYSAQIFESTDIWFSRNLVGCNNCFGCANLRNQSYCYFNEKLSPAEYKRKLAEFNPGSYKQVLELFDRARNFLLKLPVRCHESFRCNNSSGNYLRTSNNVKQSFYTNEAQNIAYSYRASRSTEIMDITFWGGNSELMYECTMCGMHNSNIKFCYNCAQECRELQYSIECRNCQYCFGCVGLRGKQYCILNKQYTEQEYKELTPKIVDHMNNLVYVDCKSRSYRYGEFFPAEFSPLEYNGSQAQEYYPLDSESAEKGGFRWQADHGNKHVTTKDWKTLPDDIRDTDDSITKEIIACAHEGKCNHQCTKVLRILPQELEFYRKLNLPIPRICVNCRHYERLKQRNPLKLWHRHCMKEGCKNEFETSYAPERPEIVYCEHCYQNEVA